RPPWPPTPRASTTLRALPVSPDVAVTSDQAPELAWLTAPPTAVASPVRPELPVLPERTLASRLVWLLMPVPAAASLKRAPRRRVLRPVAFSSFEFTTAACRPRLMSEVALPDRPVFPESPDWAVG